jgi:hypothetical protein
MNGRSGSRSADTQSPATLQVVDTVEVNSVRDAGASRRGRSVVPGNLRSPQDDYLLSLGVPEDWLPAVREIR